MNLTENVIKKHKGNLGWVLGKTDLIIDIDPRNGGDASIKKFYQDISIKPIAPTVKTASGGYHVYLTMPIARKIHKTLKKYPGVDFLSAGAQVVIPDSVVNSRKYEWFYDLFGFYQDVAPVEILNAIESVSTVKQDKNKVNDDKDDFMDMLGPDIPIETISSKLDILDPSMPHDNWIKVGMALHDWDQTLGLDLWEDWSKPGKTYEPGLTARKWDTFEVGRGTTIGSLFHFSDEAKDDNLKTLIVNINEATLSKLKKKIIPEIQNTDFNEFDKKIIVKALQNKLSKVYGVKIPIQDVRDQLTRTYDKDDDKPDWCKNWVKVRSHGAYFNLESMLPTHPGFFNTEHGKDVPESENCTAVAYTDKKGLIDCVDALSYMPLVKDKIFESSGKIYLNTFDRKSIPKPTADFTEKGLEIVDLIERHISYICNDDVDDFHTLLQWLAHQVQYPGKKINWAPLICGEPGIGKSFLGNLLSACLGSTNVGIVKSDEVSNNFNSWATGVVVNVLQELKISGHNRYEIINMLKPLITDSMIQVNEKFVKQHTVPNTTNYICFTNEMDALPLTNKDRRWWIVFTDSSNPPYVKGDNYFTKLFDGIENHKEELCKWLLEYEITEKFKNLTEAPVTSYKTSMIASEEFSTEGLSELKQLLSEGGKYYNNEMFSTIEIFEALAAKYDIFISSARTKGALCRKVGFMYYRRFWINDKTRTIYVRNPKFVPSKKNDGIILNTFNYPKDGESEDSTKQQLVTLS